MNVRVSFDIKKLSSALMLIFGQPKRGGGGGGGGHRPPMPPSPLGSITEVYLLSLPQFHPYSAKALLPYL